MRIGVLQRDRPLIGGHGIVEALELHQHGPQIVPRFGVRRRKFHDLAESLRGFHFLTESLLHIGQVEN